jgi:hypothetical protein
MAARAIMECANPVRRARAGRRLDDLRAALDRDVVHDQQEHDQGLQVQAVGDGAGLPGPLGRGRDVRLPAPALHRVAVVLDDRRGHRRGIDDLVRGHDPQVKGIAEVAAAAALAEGEQRPPVVGITGPGQVRAGCAGLPALPLPPAPIRLRGRRSAAGNVIRRRRHPGIPRVPRNLPLQLRDPRQQCLHLPGQGLHLARQLPVPLRQVSQDRVLLRQHPAHHINDPRHSGEIVNGGISGGHGQHPAPARPRPAPKPPLSRQKRDLRQHKPNVD